MAELRREHRERLAALEDRLIAMSGQVGEMLDRAMAALVDGQLEQAAAVRATKARMDTEYRAVQDGVFTTLALQAPVASDLRLVSASVHLNIHLQRMAGLCRNVVRAAEHEPHSPGDDQVRSQLADMGTHARRVLERATESFTRRDAELARTLPELDDPLDRLNRSIFRRTVELAAADADTLDWALRMVLVARNLERFGDHAVHIGEQAIFAATGEHVDFSA